MGIGFHSTASLENIPFSKKCITYLCDLLGIVDLIFEVMRMQIYLTTGPFYTRVRHASRPHAILKLH